MATKKQQSFVDTFTHKGESQYSNINLNQNSKCSDVPPIQSFSNLTNKIPFSVCQFALLEKCRRTAAPYKSDSTGNDDYISKLNHQSLSKTGDNNVATNKFSFCYDEESEETKKGWKKDYSKSSNSSTLSLHIAAYENSIEVDATSINYENESFKAGNSGLTGKFKNVKQLFFGSSSAIQVIRNPFEFPRQQKDDQLHDPQVMQFKASQKLLNLKENINVVARVRPFSKHIGTNGESCVETDTMNSTITIKATSKKFKMDNVFDGNATQEVIYNSVGQPAVDAFIDGINGTIFAYGQTGSGKTFTMLGPDAAHDESNNGVIPRSIESIFAVLNAKVEKNPDSFKWAMKCSFLELYNEKFYDLLRPNVAATIKIQSCNENVKVVGAAEFEAKTVEECMNHLRLGLAQRKVAETSMNHESSRSHAIFMLTLDTEHPEGDVVNHRSSRLNLVDLAGSERQGQTNSTDKKLKEAGSINKSLSILARVIRSLSTAKEGAYISYRDSLLTHLLRDSLGGNATTTVIVNVHPNAEFVNDTGSTLDFAVNCKKVKNTAHVNEAITSEDVEAWKAEIKRLREENSRLKDEIEKTRYSLSPYQSTTNVSQESDVFKSTMKPLNDLLARAEALAAVAQERRSNALKHLMSIAYGQKDAQEED